MSKNSRLDASRNAGALAAASTATAPASALSVSGSRTGSRSGSRGGARDKTAASRDAARIGGYPKETRQSTPIAQGISGATAAGQSGDAARAPDLPAKLNGVPDNLRSWWLNIDAQEFRKQTFRSGRTEVLSHIARRLKGSGRIVDLGCGPGMLAKECNRPDILGVDMSPAMLELARAEMDVVIPDTIFEYFPLERFDAAVLCNVLEPYSADMCRLMFRHVFEFLNPRGLIIVVFSAQPRRPATAVPAASAKDTVEFEDLEQSPSTSSTSKPLVKATSVASPCAIDLIFPSANSAGLDAEDLESELELVGFEVEAPELIRTKTVHQADLALLGEGPREERHSFIVVTGRRPSSTVR